jgi:hypothetical protein
VPYGPEQDTYVVLDAFGGRLGRAWRETSEDRTDREAVIANLLAGEYSEPVRIIAFNTAEGWSRDVTVEIADEVRRNYAVEDLSEPILMFLENNRS